VLVELRLCEDVDEDAVQRTTISLVCALKLASFTTQFHLSSRKIMYQKTKKTRNLESELSVAKDKDAIPAKSETTDKIS
jgi:hypothetical protein